MKALSMRGVVFALGMLAATSWAQVQSVWVGKGYMYLQVGARNVILDPASNNYSFNADVNGVNIQGITPPVLSGPVNVAALGSYWNGGQLVYRASDNGWRMGATGIDFGTATLANLDSIFPNGTYTFTVNGASIPLQLTGNAYPNAPVVTLTGGAWQNYRYVVDPAQPVTITTNTFNAYGTHADDLICIAAFVPGFTVPFQEVAPWGCGWAQARQFASSVPGSKTLSYTIPANTLAAGQEFPVYVGFEAIVDKRTHPSLPGSTNVASYHLFTQVIIKTQAPIFPLTVNASIGATTSNATATFQPRPQDVGTSKSVYVFALAPASVVKSVEKSAFFGMTAKGEEKDVAVQCVLAQLTSTGELKAVSTSALQAYTTNVLTGQGQAVTILNNVPTVNIAGATFYVGYGADPLAMISTGVNRRALSVPAALACDPEAPQTGWWWNTTEGGRGYSIEVSGNHLVYASYLYDVTGRATWLLASGNTSLDGSLFTSKLESYSGGQSLGGAYRAPTGVAGQDITLAFNDAAHGTMIWPGGTVAIERFNIVAGGAAMAPRENQPESGWWWNPNESGRGYFLEWQGGQLFMAGYMYDDSGNPVWYLSGNSTPSTNLQSYSNVWQLLGNGQTLLGPYKPATFVNANVAPVTIQFQGAENAIMTLPNGRTTAIRRFRF